MLRRDLTLGILAGILIGIGGSVYLSCDNKYVGAVLFSVALLCICMRGFALFTGKVGFIVEAHTRADVSALLLSLLGNLIGTFAAGAAIRYAMPSLGEKALTLCEGKLAQTAPETFLRALFCGILMYLAVVIYRKNQSVWGIFFCVPVFILSGFEHSIANMFYFFCVRHREYGSVLLSMDRDPWECGGRCADDVPAPVVPRKTAERASGSEAGGGGLQDRASGTMTPENGQRGS